MEADTSSSTVTEFADSVGFWLSFSLIIGVSAIEAFASIIWIRFRVRHHSVTDDGDHIFESSIRVCGREISYRLIDMATARFLADEVSARSGGGGIYSQRIVHNFESTVDTYGSISLIATLMIRRFNPETSLDGARGLVQNFIELFWGDGNVEKYDNVLQLIFGLADISLGISGLVLIPSSPKKLWDTLQDVTAPMTLDNYMTLFFLWWMLGVILLVAMLPLRSQVLRIQLFGCPGMVAYCIAAAASLGLFGLGCWKIDHARRNDLDWTPMLSYWIGGASAISCPCCGFEVFHMFGLVGLVFILLDTF